MACVQQCAALFSLKARDGEAVFFFFARPGSLPVDSEVQYRWCYCHCCLRRGLRSSDGDCSPLHSASLQICSWTRWFPVLSKYRWSHGKCDGVLARALGFVHSLYYAKRFMWSFWCRRFPALPNRCVQAKFLLDVLSHTVPSNTGEDTHRAGVLLQRDGWSAVFVFSGVVPASPPVELHKSLGFDCLGAPRVQRRSLSPQGWRVVEAISTLVCCVMGLISTWRHSP